MKTLNTGVSKYKNSDGQWVYIPCLTGIQGEKGEQGNPGEGVPTGGTSGQILAKNTNNSYKKICNDTKRDKYMDAKEALEYGIVDKIL